MDESLWENGSSLSEYKASPELLTSFVEKAERRIYSPDRVLFWRGDRAHSVYLVLAGRVELYLAIAEGTKVVFRAESGSLIGLPATFSNEPYSMTAVAYCNSELAVMERVEFCRMLESTPSFSIEILRILAGETRSIRTIISEMGMKRRSRN